MRALLLFFSIFQFATSLNILVYVLCLGQSHLDFMDSIVDTLVDRGHTVDVLMGKANSLVKSNGTKKVRRRFIYGYHTDCPWSKIPHLLNPFEKTPRNYDGHKVFENISSAVCEIGLSDPELYKWMSQEKYDLGVLSDYEFCGLAIFEQYGIKTKASVSALPLMDHQSILLGLPNSASVTHALFDVEDLSTIFGRFFNLLRWTNNYYNMHAYFSRKQAEIIHKYLDSSMNLDELARNYDIVFVNANELVERPRPISHKVKYIGGINMKPPKPVNPELDKIMSISTSGVVIFSFGTQVKSSTFSPEIRKSFANAFRKFPDYTFIWKYEKQPGDEKIFGNTTNLHFLNWLPQTDILNDKRTKGFISHVGLNSYLESCYAGVPILAIPLFVDQKHNAESGRLLENTYVLDKTELSEENIVKGLNAILNDERFYTNSKRIAKMLAERPNPAKQQFLEWIEFIAANPMLHKQLNQPGAQMGPFQYYCVDILLIMSISLLIMSYVIFTVLKLVRNGVFRVKNEENLKRKNKSE